MRITSKTGFLLIFTIVIIIAGVVWAGTRHSSPDTAQPRQGTPGFNKQAYSINDPSSIWVIVNKKRPLQPKTYAPELTVPHVALRLGQDSEEMRLRPDAARALEQLVTAADKQGIKLMLASGYRSYNFQTDLYNRYVSEQGQTVADRQSARPGYSEHQTGLAADLEPADRSCEVEPCFAATPEGKWLAANAATYGFIIRYSEGKESTTGYIYEPWHIRFVGTTLATEVSKTGVPTLEQFFGLPAAPTY